MVSMNGLGMSPMRWGFRDAPRRGTREARPRLGKGGAAALHDSKVVDEANHEIEWDRYFCVDEGVLPHAHSSRRDCPEKSHESYIS